jgi:uncharacterized phage infection (PIP) family protein YhgE
MLYHSWNYLTLINDIFSIKNNQFQYFEDPKSQPVTYELDFPSDDILLANAFKDFHEAAENVDRSMTQWKEEYDQISKKQASQQVTDISSTLTTAMDQIPQMTERKKKIEMHVQIATKILSEIKRRAIDKLQDFEDELMTTGRLSSANKAEVGSILARETDKVDEFQDKMRLLIIYIMCGQDYKEVKEAIDMVKALHMDKWDEAFVDSLLKKRPGDSQ